MATKSSPNLASLEFNNDSAPEAKLNMLCESIRLKIQRGASIEEIMEDIKNASLTPEGRLAIHCEIIRLKEERGTPAEELSDDIKKVCRHLLSYLPDTPKNSFRREFAQGVIEAFKEFEFRKSDVGQRFFNEIANPIARIKFLTLKLFGKDISNPQEDLDVRGYFLVKHKKDVHDLPLTEIASLLEDDIQGQAGARDGGASTSGEAQDQCRQVELPATLVDSISGAKQRKLLKAINGKGNVPIREVLSAVYDSSDTKKMEALLKVKDRLNRRLAQQELAFEISRQGETLVLCPV